MNQQDIQKQRKVKELPKHMSDLSEIMAKSGNTLHVEVVNLLRGLGWKVLVGAFYNDAIADKPREIDIVAEKDYDVRDSFGSTWLGVVCVRLYIECKYLNSSTILWFDEKDKIKATERIMKDTGLDDPRRNHTITKHHLFSDEPVAKLFASDKDKNQENEPIFKAVNQCLHATLYYRGRKNIITPDPKKNHRVLQQVYYPMIICNSFSNLYRTDFLNSAQVEQIIKPFQFEVNYAYIDSNRGSIDEYFLLDFVSKDGLPDFLTYLENTDINLLKEDLWWKEQTKDRNQGS